MSDQYEIMERMNNTPECVRARKSRRCDSSLKAFERNADRLLKTLVLHKNTKGTMVSPSGKGIPMASFEVARNFFNFVIIAVAIIDHLKEMDEDVYEGRGPDKRPRLSLMIKELKKSLTFQLAYGIRQQMQHYEIPDIFIGSGAFAMSSSSILLWEGWMQKRYREAYQHLTTNPGVHLHALALNYRLELHKLFSFYYAEQAVHLKQEYEIYEKLASELNESLFEIVRSIVGSSLSNPAVSHDMFEQNLLGRISSDDWELLDNSRDMNSRGEAMIEVLKRNHALIDEEKVRSLYKS